MQYRLLRINAEGGVGDVVMIDLADDQAALARGRDFGRHIAVEVWCGDRQLKASEAGMSAKRFA